MTYRISIKLHLQVGSFNFSILSLIIFVHLILIKRELFHNVTARYWFLIKKVKANNIEAPNALDVQLRGLHIEPSEENYALAAMLNGGKKDYRQY